jgi:GT2 family glycosyltransferase
MNFFISINYKSATVTYNNLLTTYANTTNSRFIIIDNSCDKAEFDCLINKIQTIEKVSIFNSAIDFLRSIAANEILVVRSKYNLGFANANNLALSLIIEHCNDLDNVILLNNDACLLEGDHEINGFKDENVIVGALLLKDDLSIQTVGGTDRLTWYSCGNNIQENRKKVSAGSKSFDVKGYINGAFMLMKVSTLKSIGLMEESYFMWCEEVDWCLEAKSKGIKLHCIPKLVIRHSVGGSSSRDQVKTFWGRESTRNSYDRFIIRGYYHFRNSILLVKRRYPNYTLPFVFYSFYQLFKRLVGVWLYDDKKLARTKVLFLGILHGVLGKKGKQDIS